MEALVAVALSGNVIQFVQFASELISEAKSIKNTGKTSSIPDLKNRAELLTKQAATFQECLRENNATLHQDDQV
jgi:hypothetical protein